MSKTQHFRDQHVEMLIIAKKISVLLNPDNLAKDAKEVRTLLSTLFASLGIHLSMEDKTLYPLLLKNPDEKVRTMAQKFAAEMGSIGIVLKQFKEKWPNPTSIQQNPKGFIEETKGLFGALSKRIESEDTQLYNAFDKV
jgi:iron-sulfur cluster repair protein YtfE (RIC family)